MTTFPAIDTQSNEFSPYARKVRAQLRSSHDYGALDEGAIFPGRTQNRRLAILMG